MKLLERKKHLDELDGLLRQAAGKHGHLLFLGGEAGVGKSALIRQFTELVRANTRVLTGACDALSTPRPLGPLIDISETVGGDIASRLRDGAPRADLFKAVLTDLAAHPSSLVVIEDAHWADEATLDLIRYLGRRLGSIPALVIVTYRDDEVGHGHPLRRVLGDLATARAVRRLALQPLSLDAVRDLARGSGLDPTELHRLTGGNPFFVTEVLALGEAGLPSTVRDVVLARASRLTPEGRRALDLCAVIGSSIEPWLLERVAVAEPVSECIEQGMLIRSGSDLSFRHEIAQQAVFETMSPVSRMAMHRSVLAALRDGSSQNLARLAHHAEEAGDREAVLEFAPAAAERAVALRSHREAAAQYARALRFADQLPPEQRAALMETLSYECYLTDQLAEAVAACGAALDIWRRVGDRLREGDAERKLSRLFWVSGRSLEALRASLRAIRILEELPEGPELAMAYSNLSHLRMTAWYSEEAIVWGERAIVLAEHMGEIGTLVHALTNVGTAKVELDDDRGVADLTRSLALAVEHGLEDHASRAFANLCWSAIDRFRYAQAEPYLTEGIVYCTEHDLEFMRLYLLTWRATCLMYQGHWAEARSLAQSVLGHSQLSPMSRIRALVALGRVQSRQGDPEATATLDRAFELALPIGELQRLGPVRTARAEAAWFSGDRDRVVAEALDHYEIAMLRKHRWLLGELAFWRWRAGDLTDPPEGIFEPFALQIAGNWREAAARWRALGYPFETVLALADSDDEADLRYALAEFNRLGAAPMAAKVSARLREKTERRIRRRTTTLPAPLASPPETRYARSGDVHIAYQVVGNGPIDLVFVMGWISNLELFWEGPSAGFLRRLASFSRLIIFDKRGTGLSDRVAELPTIEQRMDDVRAVMDAAGSGRAALFGISEGAAMCSVFAATYPQKVAALIIYGGYAKRVWAPDYPWAPTPFERQKFYDAIEQGWGGVVDLATLAPTAADNPHFGAWWAIYLRRSASPGAALALAKMNTEIDIRHVLPMIRVPTLILHRTGDLDIDVGGARFMAEQIPGAQLVELPGIDHLVFAGDQDSVLDEVELFLTGARPAPEANQVLATVVALEIDADHGPGETAPARDRRARIEALNQAISEELERFRGERLPASDGMIRAAFDGPGRAIRFACAAVDAAHQLRIQARAGLHTGECDRTDSELRGLPLELSAEIAMAASPDCVVLSGTVKDLVAGSGIAFREVGRAVVDAFPGGLILYEVVQDTQPGAVITGKPSPRIVMESVPPPQLSRRETEIAILIAGGLSNRQIADELSISPATAERHVSNIFNKLGYHSRAQIAAWAVEHNLTATAQ